MNAHWAWYLASEIEWAHAKDRARILLPRASAKRRLEMASIEYDPHAATELAMLIQSRARGDGP